MKEVSSKPEKHTKSQKLVDQINIAFDEIKDLTKEIHDEFDVYLDDSKLSVKHKGHKETLELKINMMVDYLKRELENLYLSSNNDNYYYFDCPSKIYIAHFEERRSDYFKNAPDAVELDFLTSEVKCFSQPHINRFLGDQSKNIYNNFIPFSDRYKTSLKRKIEFLSNKIEPLNSSFFNNKDILLSDVFDIDKYEMSDTKINNGFVNSQDAVNQEIVENTKKQLTSNQIVLLLQEIGFFTHPRIETAPKTKQSELISQICGLNSKNIKSKIENLDKKPSDLGKSNQKDIDEIDYILNSLV